MLRFLLPVLLMVLGLAGGVGAGLMLGGSPGETASAAPEDEHDAEAGTDHAEDASHGDEDGHGTDNRHGGAGTVRVMPATDDTEYVRINNQFVVPIVRHGMVRSLVVMSLTLEVTNGNSELVFEHEPRLRDSFLRVMFAHANSGGFDGTFTEASVMDPLREGMVEAAAAVLGAVVHDVLIVDITRQDA